MLTKHSTYTLYVCGFNKALPVKPSPQAQSHIDTVHADIEGHPFHCIRFTTIRYNLLLGFFFFRK